MTRTYKQRALFTLAITTLTLAVGAAGGYLLGGTVVLLNAISDLEQYSWRVQNRVELFANESNALLGTLNASHSSYCSDAELANFHLLVFRSEFIRDIGRMRNGKIDCSVSMGRLKQPLTAPPLEYVSKIGSDSYTHYRSFPPHLGDAGNYARQLGDYYVILSNYRFTYVVPASIHFVRNVSGLSLEDIQEVWGVRLVIDPRLLNVSGNHWRNGTLYVTRCASIITTERGSCTTTFTPSQTVLQNGRPQILICTAVGGLVGLCLGVFCSFIYQRSLGMERQLRRAIRKGELHLVYQPIVELSSGQIVEAEALARWTDADGFAVSPAVFVPIAEQCGYVSELTELVIRGALRDLKGMIEQNPEFRVNVNVTATDLADERFLPMLEQSLTEAGIEARNLAIELTESSAAKLQTVRETIRQLRGQGHSVQIDDFGTGYSSLSYLHDLSVDAIKIDRSFTQAIGTQAVTVSILPQILSMAKALDLQVIAEGIETAEQAGYFAGSKMNILGQGWFFGYPMPAPSLLNLLSETAKKPTLVN